MKRTFTMVELLLAVAILAVLAGLLLGIMGRSQQSAGGTQCLAYLKKMVEAVTLYQGDYNNWCLTPTGWRDGNREPVWWAVLIDNYGVTPETFCCPLALNSTGSRDVLLNGTAPEWQPVGSYGMNKTTFGNLGNYCEQKDPWSRPHKAAEILKYGTAAKLVYLGDSVTAETGLKAKLPWFSPFFLAGDHGVFPGQVRNNGSYPISARHDGQAGVAMFDGHAESVEGMDLLRMDVYWSPLLDEKGNLYLY
ncbi:type II secretion system protein [Victivallis sp. Marseille-Q1083]|uniref:type II secretion system protein n=1 Tax=Victivallis sp. Marseille-Q1083 TaxID=2717288 RepID=UPI00158AD576|nr:hypothetical protein [Victivallis sp. Marseille-Q1083]